MRRHHSIAETLAALDYDGEVPYRATIYLARLRERGLAAATTYLATKVGRADRAEVLRLARQAA